MMTFLRIQRKPVVTDIKKKKDIFEEMEIKKEFKKDEESQGDEALFRRLSNLKFNVMCARYLHRKNSLIAHGEKTSKKVSM